MLTTNSGVCLLDVAQRRDLPARRPLAPSSRRFYTKQVRDARPLRSSHSLFDNGFLLADHPLGDARPSSWYDKEHVRERYHPSARALVKRLLPNHVKVVSLDHIARNEGDTAFLGCHHMVHNDFTEKLYAGLHKMAPNSKFSQLL